MKNKFLSLLLAFSIFSSGSLLTIQKADALVGVILKKRRVRSFGAIAATVSATTSLVGLTSIIPLAATFPGTNAPIYGLVAMFYGAYFAVFGLIILDDNTVVGIDYLPINENHPDFNNYKKEEIEIFNSELDELNAIKDTMDIELQEVSEHETLGKKLWIEYSQRLHPATIKIAQDQAVKLLNNLAKK